MLSPWAHDAEYECYMPGDSISKLPVLTTGPPPAAPNHSILSISAIHLLTAAISRVRIASFSSLTISAPTTHGNGILLGLLSMILSQFTLLAHWMDVSFLTFTSAILPIGATMQSTSVIGSNFMVERISSIRH